MTDHAELRRVAALAHPDAEWFIARNLDHPNIDKPAASFIATATPKAVLALLDEIDGLSDELSACTEHPGGCGYWREAAKRRAEERDRLRAQNDALQGALHAVQAEVDGNLRPLTRDLVNMVSGLNNGTHPNDIYEHCDEIERIIGAALKGATQ
ncbi:TPA: hypothetical protein NIB10_003002 [Pseudomonas aeruginosa]|uniref:hypothetical protein n=1 Tax=Pseudomonas aeruginosa TaxID=287 RepID=UPI0003B9DF75|nr:hypothetical protein [Pseudomonas aeruginosa]EKM6409764.1 hypothetical protein [Pseudomonas aeruginosa]ERV51857.1 hypothetical protein Q062_05940 [Pseudomonas aeruginosa BL08]MBV5723186.1 hypothetical protein [Pseudomonas aeruginosa]HCF2655339.1 hypothetical protein [Pseudomonas aeruginosa]